MKLDLSKAVCDIPVCAVSDLKFRYLTTLIEISDGSYHEFNVWELLKCGLMEDSLPLFAQCYTDLLLHNVYPSIFTTFHMQETVKYIEENTPENFVRILLSTNEKIRLYSAGVINLVNKNGKFIFDL